MAMTLAPDIFVRFHSRHVDVDPTVPRPTVGGVVLHPVGSRSEAVRLSSVITALSRAGVPQLVCSLVTREGEAEDVFDAAGIPRTASLAHVESSSRLKFTALGLAEAERTLLEHTPAMITSGGDADISLAFALAASKLGIPIARVGGGLRYGDFSLSREINRILTDRLSNVVYTDSSDAAEVLQAEGIGGDRVCPVGNTAIDLLRRCEDEARRAAAWGPLGLTPQSYVLATLHHEQNIGDDERIARITDALARLAERLPLVLPLHPQTRKRMEPAGGVERLEAAGVVVTGPLGYVDFLSLQQSAGAILTDSGSVQDEASALGVPCYTLGSGTERAVTLTRGTNILVGDDPSEIIDIQIDPSRHAPAAIPFWDGRSSERIAADLARRLVAVPDSAAVA